MTQMNLSAKQKQTHRHREQTWRSHGGGGGGRGMDWQSGIGRSKLTTFRMGKPRVPNV